MSPLRCEDYVALKTFVAAILDGEYEVEPACRERAAQLLHEAPKLTKFTPSIVRKEICIEPE